jgi:hypothetical protein
MGFCGVCTLCTSTTHHVWLLTMQCLQHIPSAPYVLHMLQDTEMAGLTRPRTAHMAGPIQQKQCKEGEPCSLGEAPTVNARRARLHGFAPAGYVHALISLQAERRGTERQERHSNLVVAAGCNLPHAPVHPGHPPDVGGWAWDLSATGPRRSSRKQAQAAKGQLVGPKW